MKTLVAAALAVLLVSTGFCCLPPAFAESTFDFPQLSMPVEWVNYTIVNVNGSLWAKIDGYYPISILNYREEFSQVPMIYPTPPQTTNITLKVNGNTLNWSLQDDFLHHTAIGDWQGVSTTVGPISNSFLLTIHYEHPVEMVNGSFIFLYDLNIISYLSEQSNSSTCYYTIKFQDNATNIKAYTTKTDAEWNPISFNSTKNGDITTVSIVEHSELDKPLLGDLTVEFNDSNTIPEFPIWVILVLFIPVSLMTMCVKRFLHAKKSTESTSAT